MAAESAVPESDLTPEERVDTAIASARYGQIGLASLGAGGHFDSGGGQGGRFVFADLAGLQNVLDRFVAVRDRIYKDIKKIESAFDLCNPPANDIMSHYQANSARQTLLKKLEHSNSMAAYADAYVQKLTDSRSGMAATEQANTDRLRNMGGI